MAEAVIRWPGGSHRWRFGGRLEPDSVTRIGTVSWIVPDAAGLATLELELTGPVSATNRYDTTIRV